MEESKLPNNNKIENEIEKEKYTLKREIERLCIYEYCDDYEFYKLDKFLYYFPNRAKEIRECFREKEGKYFLQPEKKEQLQNIIMNELCSLFEHCIEKGCTVKQLNKKFCVNTLADVICLNTPENDKNIGISIGSHSKIVSTNAIFCNDDTEPSKLRFFPISGIQINHYNDKDNNFHNEIKIFDIDIDYTLIIYPETKDIKLTNYAENAKPTTFRDKKEIFKDKNEIIHFFSTLSFAEIEQVLQVLNENLKNKDRKNFDIKTVLNDIKNTIEKKRNTKPQFENEKEDKTSCNCCITCLKQCCGCNKETTAFGNTL